MRTVFLGTSTFAASLLADLVGRDRAPVLVLSRPDRPQGRGRKLTAVPVAESARALGLPLEQPADINTQQTLGLLADAQPDALIVCAFGALIKEPLLSSYKMLNVHPSLLPRWRGAAPIERAIMAGERHSGVSIMALTAGLDSGPVCLSAAEPISDDDTYGTLSERLERLGGELLTRTLDESPAFIEQEPDHVSYAEKITAADRLLDPAKPAVLLERTVRALYPHIRARVGCSDGTLIGVHQVRLLSGETDLPDTPGLWALDGRLLLICQTGALELLVIQPPGARPMDSRAYLRGHGVAGRL